MRHPRSPCTPAEVFAPVAARPHLEPIDHQPVAPAAAGPPPRRAARSTETSRCARRRSDVHVGGGARARRRRTPAAARPGADLSACTAPSAGRQRPPHAGNTGIRTTIPLAQRQVGDLMSLGGEPLRQASVPALGAADRVREQAVVDEADAHSRCRSLPDLKPGCRVVGGGYPPGMRSGQAAGGGIPRGGDAHLRAGPQMQEYRANRAADPR